jgi:YegS/Rv2252/BmrU family lipid kinase
MGPVKVILNPIAGRGYGARSEANLRRYLSAEGVDFDLVRTQGPGHAIELAAEAANGEFDIIVAAGGDGTTHEVVNGMMAASNAAANGNVVGTLGVLPVGSGSDFANTMGIPPDLEGACRQLARGQARLVDVCRVTVDEQPPRYFDNTVNIGFGGTVTFEARKVKHLRGMALYLPVVLKTIFLSDAPNVTILYDGQSVTLPAVMICVGNGSREGGSFFSTPDAKPDDGLLDVCVVREMGKLAMLGFVPRFMNGSHVGQKPVTMSRTESLVVTSPDPLIAHADGEVLCTTAHRLAFDLLPQKLRVWC